MSDGVDDWLRGETFIPLPGSFVPLKNCILIEVLVKAGVFKPPIFGGRGVLKPCKCRGLPCRYLIGILNLPITPSKLHTKRCDYETAAPSILTSPSGGQIVTPLGYPRDGKLQHSVAVDGWQQVGRLLVSLTPIKRFCAASTCHGVWPHVTQRSY